MRSKIRAVCFMFAAICLIVWGVYQTQTTTAVCGGETLHTGQTCVETKNGSTIARFSVSEKLADQHRNGWIAIPVGAVILLGAGIYLLGGRGRGRSGTAGAYGNQAAGAPGMAPAGAGAPGQPYAQQGYPQQGNTGYGQQQGWGRPQYPDQGTYPRR